MPVPTIDLAAQQQESGVSKWGTDATRGINTGWSKMKTWCDATEAAVEAAETAIDTLETGLADYLNNTSTSSNAVDTSGDKTFVVAVDRPYAAGQFLVAADAADPSANWIFGQVTSWNAGTNTVIMDPITSLGSGTITSWVITGSGPQGPSGTSSVDINGLTTATNINSGDLIPFYSITLTANRKITRANLGNLIFNIDGLAATTEISGPDKLPIHSAAAAARRSVTMEELYCYLSTL